MQDHPVAALARAQMLAMDDRLEDARTLAAAAIETFRERGDLGPYISPVAEIEMLAGNYESAEEHLQVAFDFYSTHGQPAFAASAAAMRARALCVGSADTPRRSSLRVKGASLLTRATRLPKRAGGRLRRSFTRERGDLDEAERLAREAVEFTRADRLAGFQGDALSDLASSRRRGAPRRMPPPPRRGTRTLRAKGDHPARPPHPRTTRRAPSSDGLRHKPTARVL